VSDSEVAERFGSLLARRTAGGASA
jgi:hypothetical protein